MPSLRFFIFLFSFLLFFISCCFAFDPTNYPNSQQLLPRYKVYWNVEGDYINLVLQVETTGWVGFGIAEPTSGSMPGADIVWGYVVDGKGSISDRYTLAYVKPYEDDCQDWQLISASEEDGVTTLEIKRLLNTDDDQDRPIVPGSTRVIAAFGENGIDDPDYHGTNRITSEITFFGASPTPDLSNALSIDFLMDYLVPNDNTHYVCRSFIFPSDKDYHVIAFEPQIQQENVQHVHHYILYICQNITEGYVMEYEQPGECITPFGNPGTGCLSLMIAWGAGGGPAYVPPEAGFPMGLNSDRFLVLEMHYNNPDGVGGYTDHSGVRVWYTDQLRQYDAATVALGDLSLGLPSIPPHSMTEYEVDCPSECTQQLPHEITIFQSFPHMHEVGSSIWTSHWRDGKQIGELARVEFWAFDHQQSTFVNYTLKPGDRLNTHCRYNTLNIDTEVIMGFNSTMEMCLFIVSYFPKVALPPISDFPGIDNAFSFCGFLDPNLTLCGLPDYENILFQNNPSIPDPLGGANITFGISDKKCETSDESHSSSSSTAVSHLVSFLFLVLLIF